ncbi:pyridoxamine 5'-phosphate oxidase-like FMN-binding protein [Tritrichomonas foetus]|uniref:Pyridoxamine 5'-phosphate oxidase-like FMN-binding protein n=1 Tax=Tritrichomonas foetus TaxID=1144522 RepID=A0A1J4KVY5_9EUKA|nr:pyridoxamine 5'-phosphate oxidase-like FMN-binding protein [Tritrichomonas foetus]|eukprot:OHT15298.1 pyridoxamine 5'-phosphate oxidase-like FMN-binding protein [Tritrichomonas foetus]
MSCDVKCSPSHTRMEIEEEIKLIESAQIVNFSTINSDGFPNMRPMANLRNPTSNPHLVEIFEGERNRFSTYLTTYKGSQKVKDIENNNKVSLFFIDMKTGGALTVFGTVEMVEDDDFKKRLWNDEWKRSYPAGADDPNYGVLRFTAEKVRSSFHGKSNVHAV